MTVTTWDRYAAHREKLTALVGTLAPAQAKRLCVIGAGECNDLDLAALAQRFDDIHLVDWDAEALDRATARHGSGLVKHVVDVAAMSPAQVEGIAAELGERFDFVLSPCLLSQLLFAAPRAQQAAVARHHLLLLDRLRSSGGLALLVNDFATEDELKPNGPLPREPRLAVTVMSALAGNELPGSPAALARAYTSENSLMKSCDILGPIDAWLWNFADGPELLVYAAALAGRERAA